MPSGAIIVENQQVFEQPPTAVNVTVRSAAPREYLTEREVERLIRAAGENRWGHRDATAILIGYRHGLRASEVVAFRWDDIDLQTGKLHVRRAKGGTPSVHPIGARESRALRRLQRDMIAAGTMASPYVFVSERGSPLSVAGYQRMVARAGEAARFSGPFAAPAQVSSWQPSGGKHLRRYHDGAQDFVVVGENIGCHQHPNSSEASIWVEFAAVAREGDVAADSDRIAHRDVRQFMPARPWPARPLVASPAGAARLPLSAIFFRLQL
jgi:hypothetical protein